MPRGVAARERLDKWWTSLTLDDERAARIRRTTWGIAGTTHGMDDADFGRHTVWSIIVMCVSAVLGLITVRPFLAEGQLAGPGLLPLPESDDVRDFLLSTWVPDSLGWRGPPDAFTRLLAIAPFPQALPAAILIGAIPAAALAAWWAAGTVSRSVVVRLVAAMAWILTPTFLESLSSGRWPFVLVHILIPVAAYAFAHAIGLPHKVSQASVSAAAGCGLVVAAISAIQPVLGILLIAGAIAVAPVIPGRRKRLWWIVIPTLVLHLPNLATYLAYPKTMLSAAGIPLVHSGVDARSFLAFSSGANNPVAQALGLESWWGALATGAPLLLVVACAIGATLLYDTAGVAARYALLAAGGALLAALGVTRISQGFDGGVAYATHPGALLSIAAAGAIAGFTCVGDALSRRAVVKSTAAKRLVTRVSGAVALLVMTAGVAAVVALVPAHLETARQPAGSLPAVAADFGHSSLRGRSLVLAPQAGEGIRVQVVTNGEKTVDQEAASVRARLDAAFDRAVSSGSARSLLADAVASALYEGTDPEEGPALGDFGVSYVVVQGSSQAHHDIMDALARSSAFEEVTAGENGGLYRFLNTSARAVISSPEGEETLVSLRTEVRDTVTSARAERTIRLAERWDSNWGASIGDTELEPVMIDGWAQGFVVPAGVGGELEIAHRSLANTALVALSGIGLTLTLLIAIPRRRAKEDA